MEKKDLGNDVVYEVPPMTPIRWFKFLFMGRDIFPEGIINKLVSNDKIMIYEVPQETEVKKEFQGDELNGI